jgi:beta-lactamase regulating signal transducer with metallopeptidase domain
MSALLIVIRATVLLAVVAMLQQLFRRRTSAAARHFLWTLAIAAVLLLPLASVVMPEWRVVVHTTRAAGLAPPSTIAAVDTRAIEAQPTTSVPATLDVETLPAAPAPARFPWASAIAAAYAAGLLVMAIHVMAGQRSVRRFVRGATVVSDDGWMRLLAESADAMGVRRQVRLLRSRERSVPIALGIVRPSIVVPAIADTWDTDRRRAVLLHEMAHVARYDCLTQVLAVAACAIYWFHPAAWFAARRLRVERELACDDRVIAAGAKGRDYAAHLLEIAYSFGSYRAPALAVGMARRNQLEGRMIAALDARRNRTVPPRRVRFTYAAVGAVLLLTLSSVRPAVMAEPQSAPAVAAEHTVSTASAAATPYSASSFWKAVAAPWQEGVRRLVSRAATAIQSAQSNQAGTWEIRPTNAEGTIHLRLVELHSSHGTNVRIDQFQGLTAPQLSGAGGPVQFRLRRDAGTFLFEGVIRNGVGAGTFSFTLDPAFAGELEKRGFARPTPADQYELARSDVGYAYIDELSRQGYSRPSTGELVRAAQHGVHLTYLQEIGALGYRLGSLEPLITLRDHGVSPSYIRGLAEQGYKGLTADELRNARDHGISTEYVRGMRDAGYTGLSMKELINARDHGVSPEFVRELGDAGHRKLPLEEVIRVRDHGVSPEYVREMRQLGHALPLPALVNARDHGVSVEFVREMASLGYSKLPMEALVRLRDHGVSPEYVKALKDLGYDKLSPDDLIMLRDHGLSAERIRSANARAGSRLPIDLLKSLAAGGMR